MNEITIFAIMVLLIVVPIITLIGISYKTIWNNDLTYLWVNALEMGFYEQAKGILHSSNHKYCCLGVLCNILSSQGIGKWRDSKDYYSFFTDDPLKTSCAFFPVELRSKINLTNTKELMDMNDGNDFIKPHSFKEIAQYIRKNIKLKNI